MELESREKVNLLQTSTGFVKTVTVSLYKVGNDPRLLPRYPATLENACDGLLLLVCQATVIGKEFLPLMLSIRLFNFVDAGKVKSHIMTNRTTGSSQKQPTRT